MDATKLVNALAPLAKLVADHEALARQGPAERSQAALDASRPQGHRTWILANQMWASGAEHAVVWRDLLVGAQVQPHSAHYTLLRGTLEGVTTCRYLVDVTVGQSTRIARACALQLEDWRQRKNFEERPGTNLPTPPPPAKRARERIDDLRADMRANGITDTPLPSFIERFRTHGDGEWLYRVLSAHAHGFEWAMLTSEMTHVDDASPWPGSGAGLVAASEPLTLQMTELAVQGVHQSLEELRRYAGR